MKAAVYDRYGPPEVLEVREVAAPVPGDNEVLIRIRATTVCAADWRMRKADPFFIRLFMGLRGPRKVRILGMEFSGEIEAVGKCVSRFHKGDAVFGSAGFQFGCHAEFLCLPESGQLAMMPRTMSFEEAAAVMFGGVSALCFLRRAKIQAGQKVLIYGASGSVGVFAVQLAKYFGAQVTGVCSTRNVELVKSLGADHVVDYTTEDFSQVGPIYDVLFDTVGHSGFRRSMRCLKRGGACVQVGYSGKLGSLVGWMVGGLWARTTGKAKMIGGVAQSAAGDQAFFTELIEAGKLRTVIDRRYRLDEIAEAHRYAQAGHKVGHVVITIG